MRLRQRVALYVSFLEWLGENKMDDFDKLVDSVKENNTKIGSVPDDGKAIKGKDVFKNKGFFQRFKIGRMFKKKAEIVLIHMELENGTFKTFYVGEDVGFHFNDGYYIFDYTLRSYNVDLAMYQYFYAEGFSLPLRITFDLPKVRNAVKSTNDLGADVEYSLNPRTLRQFIDNSIIQEIYKGGDLDKTLRRVFIVVCIILVCVIGLALLFMQKSGVFASVGG